jgi:hypothetical protein
MKGTQNMTMTYHGAELWNAFEKAGGTKEQWVEKVAPILKAAGQGPLYRMSAVQYELLMSFAKAAS